MSRKRDRSPEEIARREKIRELLQVANVGSMADIQELFKETIRSSGFSVSSLMDVLLADNGGEFSDVFSFENDPSGHTEIRMFFCDPMRSCQKPFIEKNHTLFRDIVPKGSSFDDLEQDTVDFIFSHVNSVSRSIYSGMTPFDLCSFLYGADVPALFGISKIPSQEVIQSPKLLKGLVDLKKNL